MKHGATARGRITYSLIFRSCSSMSGWRGASSVGADEAEWQLWFKIFVRILPLSYLHAVCRLLVNGSPVTLMRLLAA